MQNDGCLGFVILEFVFEKFLGKYSSLLKCGLVKRRSNLIHNMNSVNMRLCAPNHNQNKRVKIISGYSQKCHFAQKIKKK